ncbi:hypothetical protein pb186bvf_002083 [Paramecium bursaria]
MQKKIISKDFQQDSYINDHQDSDDDSLVSYNENSDHNCEQGFPQNQEIGQQQNSTLKYDQHKNNTQTVEKGYNICELHEENEQVQTKNLPKLFGRLLYSAFVRQCCLNKKIQEMQVQEFTRIKGICITLRCKRIFIDLYFI